MVAKISFGIRQAKFTLIILLSCNSLLGCLGVIAPAPSQDVQIAPIAEAAGTSIPVMTRTELQDQVMRFADRYAARLTLMSDRILDNAQNVDERWLAMGWKMASRVSTVSIAVGPDAVTNLLDMLVLATLGRLHVKSYWAPKVIGDAEGRDLLEAIKILERDIWLIADKVLTPEQQDDLRSLIQDWYEAHLDQHYFWHVRFGAFSDQRAARLTQLAQSGGLLGQIQQTRESVDKLHDLGERVLYYMQHAGALTRLQVQFGVYEILRQPEMRQVLGNVDRFEASVERFATVAETLPAMRLQAINQFMEKIAAQRQALINDLVSEEPRVRAVLGDVRETIALGNELATTVNNTVKTVDQLANKLKMGEDVEASEEFDIKDYRGLIGDTQTTVDKLAQLVESLDILMSTEAWGDQNPQALRIATEFNAQIERLVTRIVTLAVVLIVVFFVALFAYRYAIARVANNSSRKTANHPT